MMPSPISLRILLPRNFLPNSTVRRVLVALVLFVISVMVVISLVDDRIFLDRIVRQVEQQTGLQIIVNKDAQIHFFPVPFISLSNVRVSDLFSSEPFLNIDKLELKVGWWAVLSRSSRDVQGKLINPVFSLNIDKDGISNLVNILNGDKIRADIPDRADPAALTVAALAYLSSIGIDTENGRLITHHVNNNLASIISELNVSAGKKSNTLFYPIMISAKFQSGFPKTKGTFSIRALSRINDELSHFELNDLHVIIDQDGSAAKVDTYVSKVNGDLIKQGISLSGLTIGVLSNSETLAFSSDEVMIDLQQQMLLSKKINFLSPGLNLSLVNLEAIIDSDIRLSASVADGSIDLRVFSDNQQFSLRARVTDIASSKIEILQSDSYTVTTKLSADLSLSTGGAIEQVDGYVKVAAGPGTIADFDLVAIVELLTGTHLVKQNTGNTAFNSAEASFDVANGVATATTLHVNGRGYHVVGDGVIDLPGNRVKINTELGFDDNKNVKIPILVDGTLSNPNLHFDIDSLVKNRFLRELSKALQ